MSARATPFVCQPVWEDSGLVLMARIMTVANIAAVQADISSITLKVFASSNQATPIATATLVVADTIYNTLQTGGPWTKDQTGYNFRYLTLATQIPDGDETYRFEFVVTPTEGAPIPMVFEVPTVNLWGS